MLKFPSVEQAQAFYDSVEYVRRARAPSAAEALTEYCRHDRCVEGASPTLLELPRTTTKGN